MDQHDLKEMARARYGGIAQAANNAESCRGQAASRFGSSKRLRWPGLDPADSPPKATSRV